MKTAIALSLVAGLAAASTASAQVAYWAFPSTVPASNVNFQIAFPISADTKANAGTAQITTNGQTFVSAADANSQGNYQYFSGSTVNAVGATPAGSALAIRGNGVSGGPYNANGKYVQFQFDTTGFYTISMTWAERGTTTGPTSIAVEWSTDGSSFTSAGSFVPDNTSTYKLRTVDLSSIAAIQNQPAVYVRYTLTGYTSQSGGYRFENVQVLPTPGAMALLGIGGLVASRRRRA